MPDWMDGEVEADDNILNSGQVSRLLQHNECLREVIHSVFEIKQALESKDYVWAEQLWRELSEGEQEALWVAPKFGGIFTTEERSIIKGGFRLKDY